MNYDSDSKECCYFCGEDVRISKDCPNCINCGKKLYFTEEEREQLKQKKEKEKQKHEAELKQRIEIYEKNRLESLH